MMLNGTYEIDRVELANRARMAREKNGYTQLEAGMNIGVGQSWVSQVELGKLNLHAENVAKVKELAKHLDFDVPVLGKGQKPIEVKTAPPVVDQPKAPEKPAKVDEIDIMRICSDALSKLDTKACYRVLGYLRAKHVMADEPIPQKRDWENRT